MNQKELLESREGRDWMHPRAITKEHIYPGDLVCFVQKLRVRNPVAFALPTIAQHTGDQRYCEALTMVAVRGSVSHNAVFSARLMDSPTGSSAAAPGFGERAGDSEELLAAFTPNSRPEDESILA